MMGFSDITFTRLSAASSSLEIASLFPRVIDLSHDIFWLASPESKTTSSCHETEESRRMSERVWRSRLENEEGVCYVALQKRLFVSPSRVAPPRPVGFVLAHRSSNTGNTALPPSTVHMWVTGVDPAYRRRGILHELVAMLSEDVRRGRWGGVRTLSVRTIPTRFGAMVAWLETDGWVEVPDEGEKERIAFRKVVA